MTDNVTIYAAEMMALKMALEWIKSESDRLNSQVVIFSDSLSSLKKLLNSESKSRPRLYVKIKEILHGINTEMKFCWLPSHVDIAGNEQADKLANMATILPMVEKDIKRDK